MNKSQPHRRSNRVKRYVRSVLTKYRRLRKTHAATWRADHEYLRNVHYNHKAGTAPTPTMLERLVADMNGTKGKKA